MKKKVEINFFPHFPSNNVVVIPCSNMVTLEPHCYPKSHSAALGRWYYVPHGSLWAVQPEVQDIKNGNGANSGK
jgi:hypothetical protein